MRDDDEILLFVLWWCAGMVFWIVGALAFAKWRGWIG